MSDYEGDELELGDYLAILKRRWLWFVVPLLALPAAAFYLSSNQVERFNATAEVLLSDTAAQDAVGGGSQSISFRNRILENEISLALSDEARATIEEQLGFSAGFTVTADDGSDVLVFRASRSSADEAAQVANVAAETYVDLKQEQASASITSAVANLEGTLIELQDEREVVRADLILLEDALARASEDDRPAAQAAVDRESSRISGQVALIDAQIAATANSITQLELTGELALSGTARLVSVASPPANSANPPPSRNIVLGLVVGAILGAALALLRENLDNKIRTVEDFERFGLTPLGSIPAASKREQRGVELATVTLHHADTAQAQAVQKAQASIRFLCGQHDLHNVMVTSPSQGEGKTTLASNLAIAMAMANLRTVLVDLDLRRPRIHKAYGISQSPGISTTVVDGVDVVETATLVPGIEDNLAVVPAGKIPPHAASFISSRPFADTVKELGKLSDFTVFDAPPVLPVADTLTLCQMVGGVIVVAYANQTKVDDFGSAIESLQNSGARILGAVLMGAATQKSGYEYYNDSSELERM